MLLLQRRLGAQRASSAIHQDPETRLGQLRGMDRANTLGGVNLDARPSTTHALYRVSPVCLLKFQENLLSAIFISNVQNSGLKTGPDLLKFGWENFNYDGACSFYLSRFWQFRKLQISNTDLECNKALHV